MWSYNVCGAFCRFVGVADPPSYSYCELSLVKCGPTMFVVYVAGLWVWLTLLPTLIVNSKQTDRELCTRDYIGWGVWLAGMLIECIADYQKYNFRSNDANKYVICR